MSAAASEPGGSAEALWRAAVATVLKGAPFETLVARSLDGVPLGPLSPAARVGEPAPWRDTARPFGVIQRIDHPDPEDAGRQAIVDVESGATGLVLSLAGHPAARGFGLPSAAPDALAAALEGVAIDAVTLRLEAAYDGWDAAAALAACAERRMLRLAALDVDFGLDPLSHAAATGQREGNAGTPVLARAEHLRSLGFSSPLMRADGRVHGEAGASEAQELAAVLSAGVTYLRALQPLGLDAARQTLSFTLTADTDQILTVAKLRALRRLWARIEQACGLDPRPIRLHAETAWRTLARRDPWTNVLRATIAGAAAILGGADSLGVLPFTGALGLPDPFARRLARNTPLVLLEEAHLGRVADAAAGAGAFEDATAALCVEAWRLFQDLERVGGLAGALAAGTWQRDVAAIRARRQAAIAEGRATLVGVTAFGTPGAPVPAVLRPAPASRPHAPNALPSWRDAAADEDADEAVLA